MSEEEIRRAQGARLAGARERAGFKSARAAALALGWPESSYRAHENGTRTMGRDDADRYAKRYRALGASVTAAEILFGDRPMAEEKNVVPVMGRIGAGAEITPDAEQIPPDGLYDIDPGVSLPDGMIGFEVVGDSMYPRYDEGDVVIVGSDGVSPESLPDGAEVAVRTGDGRRFLKRLRREAGAWTLESHNAAPMRGLVLVWVSEVVSVARQRQWRRLNGKVKK